MSLYNLLHGFNPNTDQILQVLGHTRDDFGRFRDVYIKDGFIVVHTRCGGGNREEYESVFEMAEQHPWYSYDEDCDFDSIYANIYFKIPNDETGTFVGLYNQGIEPSIVRNEIFENLSGKGNKK